MTDDATAKNPEDTTPLYLLTVEGTILFYDEQLGQIRHGSFSEAPHNLAVLIAPDWHSLAVLRDGAWIKLWATPRLVPFDRGCFGLRVDENFLHADESGTVAFRPLQDGSSAVLLYPLVSENAVFLRHFLGNGWRSVTNDAIIRPRVAVPENRGFAVRLGDIELDLAHFLANRESVDPCPKTIFLAYDEWRIERLTLYRPLVYFTAFGRADIFECLDLALESLVTCGGYSGDILVMTEKSPEEFFQLVAFRSPNLTLIHHQANDFLEFCLARYAITDWRPVGAYQPILYLDTDVLCVAPIGHILDAVLAAPAMCIVAEHDLFAQDVYYGAKLFRDDPSARPKISCGLNTGVLGLPNIENVRNIFSAIRRHAVPIAQANGSRDWSSCYDQPVANYLLHKVFAFDTGVLQGRVRSSLYEPDMAWKEGGPAFFHFSGGVGFAGPKLAQMQACMKRLRGEVVPDPSLNTLP